jgi:hypothetical protein
MGTKAAKRGRLKIGLMAVFLLAASCSVTDDLLGNEVDDTTSSAGTDEATSPAESGTAASEETEPERPSIWSRGGDASMRPTAPHASVNQSMAPGNGDGWTIVGSVYHYDTGISQPAVWSADEPDSRESWTRIEVEETADGGAHMAGATRADGFDVAVGDRGEGQGKRAAVWLRSSGDQWRSVDWSQFDRGVPEHLSRVAADQSSGLVIAIGEQTGADNEQKPVVWTSPDGENWDAIEDLPFASGGIQSLRSLAVGSNKSVATGQQTDSTMTAIAFWSEDGRTWNQADVETPSDGGRSYMGESTWFEDRFVAVGGVATGDVFRPASWTSVDGKVWELQQVPFETMDDGRIVNVGFGAQSITSTDSMIYATADSGFLQQLWQSPDGTNWTVVGDITDVRSVSMNINSIAAAGNQILLTTEAPDVLIYEDKFERAGLRSDLLPLPDEYPWVSDLAYADGGWVAVGGSSVQLGGDSGTPSDGTNDVAMLWRSADGVDWEVAERLPEASTGPVSVATPFAGGLVAVGTETIRSANAQERYGRGLIWELAASGWEELDAQSARDDEARVGLLDVASAGGDVLAGGWRYDPTGDDTDALLIQRTADSAPQVVDIGHQGSDNEFLVALCGNQAGEAVAVLSTQQPDTNQLSAVRRSSDREWSDARWEVSPNDERATVVGCEHGADGFVAAGFAVGGGSDTNVGLWRSADGTMWERVEGPPGFSAAADQSVDSIVATEDGYLLAGTDASSGENHQVVWYGSGDDWGQVIVDEAVTMGRLQVGYGAGTVVVAGWDDGAVRIYVTTLEQVKAEVGQP